MHRLRDDDGSRGDLPVVVVNGLGAPHAAAWSYARLLRTRGFTVFPVTPSFLGLGDIRAAARRVDETVQEALAATGQSQVRLVGMSLGGLIGLYYIRCGGGAARVERFISVGGPLNGSRLACAARLTPVSLLPAVRQVCRRSDLVREVRDTLIPGPVRMYSVGTRGDVVTPRGHWDAVGFHPVATPHGFFPLGHWCLFLLPGNHRVVADLLETP